MHMSRKGQPNEKLKRNKTPHLLNSQLQWGGLFDKVRLSET